MIPLLNLSGFPRLPIIRQAEAAECGLASVAMVAGFYGFSVDMSVMRRRFPLSIKGMTLRTIVDIAASIGLSSRAIRLEISEIRQLKAPAILHWGTNHFVVLKDVVRRGVIIHDPAHGRLVVPFSLFSRMFTGVALELTPTSSFQRATEKTSLGLEKLFSISSGIGRALAQTLILAVVAEALVLTTPFYLQFVIDEAIFKNDQSLLVVLAIAFGFVALFRAIAVLLRGLSSQYISNVLSFEMKGRIFNHLIRLPLDWFQKRHIGDIQSRFWALKSVQTFVSQGALSGILDGFLGVFVLALLYVYSGSLLLLVLISCLLHVILKLASFNVTKRFAADAIVTDAREQTKLLETLRAAQTIKSSGSERVREGQYRNAAADSINSQIRSGNVSLFYGAADQILVNLTDVLVIYIGAKSVISGQLTVGMLTAFLAYKSQFVFRFSSFVDQVFAWRLLDVQLERLSDIVLTPKEARVDYGGYVGDIKGSIECKNLSFRYAFGEPLIIHSFNASIKAGECVAIVGQHVCK